MSKVKDRILAALQLFRPQPLDVPELGGTVYVRPLTVAGMARVHRHVADARAAADKARAAAAAKPDDADLVAAAKQADHRQAGANDGTIPLMLADCIVDEDGRRIFDDGDEDALAALPSRLGEQLLDAVNKVSALTANDPGAAAGN